jgi:hypothetical protein
MGIMRIQVCISRASRSRMIVTDQLISKCVFPYQFLLLKIHSLRSSLISGKLPIGKLGQRIGSGNACYRNQKSPTIPYLKAVAITIGLLPVGSIDGHPRSAKRAKILSHFSPTPEPTSYSKGFNSDASSSILRNSRRSGLSFDTSGRHPN